MSTQQSPRNDAVQFRQGSTDLRGALAASSFSWPTQVGQLLLTPKEAAACLSVSRAHLYRLLQAGELRAVHSRRAARIPYAELQRYVARLLNEGGASTGENR